MPADDFQQSRITQHPLTLPWMPPEQDAIELVGELTQTARAHQNGAANLHAGIQCNRRQYPSRSPLPVSRQNVGRGQDQPPPALVSPQGHFLETAKRLSVHDPSLRGGP